VTLAPFPSGWRRALVLVPHPDDPEYGIGAAVAKWTAQGRTVVYALASRGERGIEGMPPEQAGPLREGEQIRSAAIVGVDDVRFWDFPDSDIHNTAALRARIAETIAEYRPEVVITIYGGPEWAPGQPNQRDHMEFAKAVTDAWDEMGDKPRWLFENGPDATHGETVDGYVDVAVASLTATSTWPSHR
jgi:LmbE family N-acetylglucosaminyl deacetylase